MKIRLIITVYIIIEKNYTGNYNYKNNLKFLIFLINTDEY